MSVYSTPVCFELALQGLTDKDSFNGALELKRQTALGFQAFGLQGLSVSGFRTWG